MDAGKVTLSEQPLGKFDFLGFGRYVKDLDGYPKVQQAAFSELVKTAERPENQRAAREAYRSSPELKEVIKIGCKEQVCSHAFLEALQK